MSVVGASLLTGQSIKILIYRALISGAFIKPSLMLPNSPACTAASIDEQPRRLEILSYHATLRRPQKMPKIAASAVRKA